MRLGCCASIDQANVVHAAGFDFIECTVVSLIPERSEEDFAEVLKKYQESPIPVEVCNVFLPGDLKVVGESVDLGRINRYLKTSLARVKQIGADTIVFGSGGARTIPEGFSREKAEEQIFTFLDLAADYAEPLGLTIVIEPLNTKESNILNSVPEAVEFARKINRKSIQVLADFYHMDEEKEPLTNIVTMKEYVKHIHVADTGRLAPGSGQYPYQDFTDCLMRANYNGRVSIECGWHDFEDEAARAREYLESCFSIR
ncbi:sugar phosphate isomerase/epimerase family protein [Halalkalibacter kiskunsagensis]|uniref:Sugar phosphate isomerase/epimerase family protein n=1 Tax=Halalkalibacter kiskunsagensis TaxID=1548599 RepID=A0ABV6KJE1_9BACI